MGDSINRIERWGIGRPCILAATWAACTFLIWLLAVNANSLGWKSEAALTVVALLAQPFTLGLRFGRFSGKQPSAPASVAPRDQDAWTWLLTWSAQINVLGWVALMGPSLATALPAAIVIFTLEWLVWSAAPDSLHIGLPAQLDHQKSDGATEGDQPEGSDMESFEVHGDDAAYLRSATFGQLPSGEFFVSGWVRYAFAAGQKSTTISVGFSPPFASVPTIDLDDEPEEDSAASSVQLLEDASGCEANVEHATPAGMRIALKRSGDQPACRGKVHWHATSAREQADETVTRLRTHLP